MPRTEEEYRQLELTIHNLKVENNGLKRDLAEMHKFIKALDKESSELERELENYIEKQDSSKLFN